MIKTTIFDENTDFFEKSADISKIKEVLVLKGIFSEITYVYVLIYQIFNELNQIKYWQVLDKGGNFTPTSIWTFKKPAQIRVKLLAYVAISFYLHFFSILI